MGAVTIQQMADRVSALLEDRLRIRGATLTDKARRARRQLPRRVRQAVDRLAAASAMARNPRLLMQIDEAAVAEAYDIAVRHLVPLGASARRRSLLVATAAQAAFGLVVVVGVVVMLLRWRGTL